MKDHNRNGAQRHNKSLQERLTDAEQANEGLREQVHYLDMEVCRLDGECAKWEKKAAKSEHEIMRLKAMLFDLMFEKKVAG